MAFAMRVLIEPWLSVAQVELAQRRCETSFQHYLAEALALRQVRNVGITLQPLPVHQLELFAERFFVRGRIPTRFSWGEPGAKMARVTA